MAETLDLILKKQQLRLQKAFLNLNDSEIDVLSTLLIETPFKAGETIVEEGDRVDSIYIIVQGKADVFRSDIENDVTTSVKLATLSEGRAIGLSDVGFYSLTGLRTATVVAATDLLTLKLSVSRFRGFTLAYPHANEVMRKQTENLF
jgi:CRP-like cAMP-binding protein